jgi:Domain of unknown function (DUF4280)
VALLVPVPTVSATTPVATAADTIPGTNIPTFGMCMSLGNPAVAMATSAANGVLTPQPCVPAAGSPGALVRVRQHRRHLVRAHHLNLPVQLRRRHHRGHSRPGRRLGDVNSRAADDQESKVSLPGRALRCAVAGD